MDWLGIGVIVAAVVVLILVQFLTGAGSRYACNTPRDRVKGRRLKGELSDLKNAAAEQEQKSK